MATPTTRGGQRRRQAALLLTAAVAALALAPTPAAGAPADSPSTAADGQGKAPPAGGAATLKLANTLGSHMVLQRGPLPACLYGTGAPFGNIQVAIEGNAATSTQTTVDPVGNWVACMPPQEAGGPHTITVAGSGGKETLTDVYFGEVWLCAGQSNMQMSLSQAFNATKEIQAAAKMKGPPVRVMALALATSAEPVDDVMGLLLPWSVASPESLGGPKWEYFSAACWFYGRDLAQGLGVPVGLIQSAYGATELRAWSPPGALNACPFTPDPWADAASAAAGAAAAQQPGQEQGGSKKPPAPKDEKKPAPKDEKKPAPKEEKKKPSAPPKGGEQQPQPKLPQTSAVPVMGADGGNYGVGAMSPAQAAAAAGSGAAAEGKGKGKGKKRRLLRRELAPAAAAAAAAAPSSPDDAPALRPWMTEWHPEPSACFNAMVHPLRLMSLRGVIWDQGEQDVHQYPQDYACLLPAFIDGWRRAFPYANALEPMYFGILQLQGYTDDYMDITENGTEVGRIRLAQYAGLSLPNVFFAVGYDLNDDSSPFGPVHFRGKQEVGARLANAALANVYGEWGSLTWGPGASEVSYEFKEDPEDKDALLLIVHVGFVGVVDGLVDSGVNIFEVATSVDATDYEAEVIESSGLELEGTDHVSLTFVVPKTHALAQANTSIVLRYAYKNKPCPERKGDDPRVGAWCGLYSSEEQPALPFVVPMQATGR